MTSEDVARFIFIAGFLSIPLIALFNWLGLFSSETPAPIERLSASTSANEPISKAIAVVIVGFLCVGIPLGVLYFLVRFVKWAWTDY